MKVFVAKVGNVTRKGTFLVATQYLVTTDDVTEESEVHNVFTARYVGLAVRVEQVKELKDFVFPPKTEAERERAEDAAKRKTMHYMENIRVKLGNDCDSRELKIAFSTADEAYREYRAAERALVACIADFMLEKEWVASCNHNDVDINYSKGQADISRIGLKYSVIEEQVREQPVGE
jgi:hypothetical protein